MRIGIFGGTFNPPHKGHRHIAEDFRDQMAAIGLPLDKVFIIPTYVPPHKAAPDLASGEDRLAMCRLCFEKENAEHTQAELAAAQASPTGTPEPVASFEVSDLEIRREGASYTWMTLEDLHEQYDEVDPETGEKTPAELYFVMGDDMLLYLPQWKYPERVLDGAVLVSTIRSHECSVEELRNFAKTNYPDQYAAGRFLFFESEPFPVSSTEVRELVKKISSVPRASENRQAQAEKEPVGTEEHCIATDKQRLEHLLDADVLQYILERELYQ